LEPPTLMELMLKCVTLIFLPSICCAFFLRKTRDCSLLT